jgi:hypothetical protein
LGWLVDSPIDIESRVDKGIQELLAMIQFFRRIDNKSEVESLSTGCNAFLVMVAVLLLVCANGVRAQQNGPMPAATPSDQPAQSSANSSSTAGAHPNLAGTWKLNKDQSDDVREKMQEAGAGGGQGGGWGGGNGGGFGGRGGGGMGGGRRGGGEGGMMQEYSQLAIEQTASTVRVTGSSGRVLAQYDANASGSSSNNGASSSTTDNQGGQGERNAGPAAAQWQDAKLVATEQGRRGTTTRTYELSPDGKQLYVTTRIDNPRFSQPVTIRFVYDSQKAGG